MEPALKATRTMVRIIVNACIHLNGISGSMMMFLKKVLRLPIFKRRTKIAQSRIPYPYMVKKPIFHMVNRAWIKGIYTNTYRKMPKNEDKFCILL